MSNLLNDILALKSGQSVVLKDFNIQRRAAFGFGYLVTHTNTFQVETFRCAGDVAMFLEKQPSPPPKEATCPPPYGYVNTDGLAKLCQDIHRYNVDAGWWTNIETGERLDRNVPEMLMLIVSEISEAMEGYRKNLMDDKLPHRKMIEVELADAVIRICDTAEGLGLDLAGAVREKIIFNTSRPDHKIENRLKENGKKF